MGQWLVGFMMRFWVKLRCLQRILIVHFSKMPWISSSPRNLRLFPPPASPVSSTPTYLLPQKSFRTFSVSALLELGLRPTSRLLQATLVFPWSSPQYVTIGVRLPLLPRELWSSVLFPSSATGLISLAQLWLSRGGNLPLSAHIWFDAIDTWDLVDIFCLHIARWYNVQVVISRSAQRKCSISGRFPILSQLTLIQSNPTKDIGPTDDSDLILDMRDAPVFFAVRLFFFLKYDCILLPWSQLVLVELHNCVFDVKLSVFHLCPRLFQSSLTHTRDTFEAETQPAVPYSHLGLKHFFVNGYTHDVYNFFTFPSLTNLTIRKWVTNDLIQFLARTPTLKVFSVGVFGSCTSSDALLVILGAVALIIELCVDCTGLSAGLCAELLHAVGRTLSNLERLILTDDLSERGFTYTALAVMLCAFRPRLTSCIVVFNTARVPGHTPPSAGDSLRMLHRQGMDIRISSPALSWSSEGE
ncbi:hypothetical protein DFH09DRAFT_1092659 [Mycena vulgaris]|nr:hypothetical protein DFH09DRAFT_1092659 [Mycena vulgaris]